jgi:hypothetical protein
VTRIPWRLVLVGVAFTGLAVPLILGMVPRNWLYGFRTAYTMSSDEAWYHANRIAGFTVLAAGAAWTAVAVILPLAWRSERALWWVVGLGISFLMLALITSWILVHRGR